MRWFWIDRFTEFVSGQSATAIKTLSLSEDHLHDHFPGASVMPNTLILEGMAQTAGLLVCEHSGFTKQVILAKVSKAVFHGEAWPGDMLTYRALLQDIKEDGAMTTVTSEVNGKPQAEAEIFFAHLEQVNQRGDRLELFVPYDLFSWLRLLKLYEVGRDADGNPLQIHPRMAESDPFLSRQVAAK
ncbi:MAG TPA: 3-hydroxyacyl-ACP dehydratase FabZ family protein [Pirellulales bacterium]|jgi:3-hydroxyacyl-[acyl-carrier-protein] dehydratase|nr:3-hydroxyacyl-ACP dehydratase FabZ family protein [Pirellulales bacterium]